MFMSYLVSGADMFMLHKHPISGANMSFHVYIVSGEDMPSHIQLVSGANMSFRVYIVSGADMPSHIQLVSGADMSISYPTSIWCQYVLSYLPSIRC